MYGVTWSVFTRYMNEHKGKVAASLWNDVRRRGIDRWAERQRAGRADSVLAFDDLVAEVEASLSGAKR